jgi:hypothetical protein
MIPHFRCNVEGAKKQKLKGWGKYKVAQGRK